MVTKSTSMKKSGRQSRAKLIGLQGKNKSTSNTRTAEKVVLIGLVFAAVFWVFQSIVDVVLFSEGSLVEQILTPGLHDIWMRTLVICTLIMFGVYAQSIITERKQAEEALRQSEGRYRTILKEMQDGYYEVDLAGNFTFVNDSACRYLGYSRDEMMGMNYRVYTAKEDVETVYRMFNQVYRTGEPVEGFSWRAIRKDGIKGFAETSISPLRNDQGDVAGFRCVGRDVSERKQAEVERAALLKDVKKMNRKLEQSNKELQDFVYVASHDLREPLRKVTSFGTLLQDSLEGRLNEDEQENFEFMIDGAHRMQAMIDDLLIYSRVTTRAKPFEQVDLNEVIGNLKKLELATLLDESKGTLRVLEPLPLVQGDPSQMHQLLQNLIGNGLKFHKEAIPPGVTIRAHMMDGNMVRVEVEDNGIGIDEQYHEQVFTMFKRLHSRERYEGTGIGLAICKKIVNRHGGDIGIKSTSGGGTAFWFTLRRGSYS